MVVLRWSCPLQDSKITEFAAYRTRQGSMIGEKSPLHSLTLRPGVLSENRMVSPTMNRGSVDRGRGVPKSRRLTCLPETTRER